MRAISCHTAYAQQKTRGFPGVSLLFTNTGGAPWAMPMVPRPWCPGVTFSSNMCSVTLNLLQTCVVPYKCADYLTMFHMKSSSINYCVDSLRYQLKCNTSKIYFHVSETVFWLQLFEELISVTILFCQPCVTSELPPDWVTSI